ncbi:apolipoprotein F [Rhineura floridana]|uniref:apolipoprotein F n=1 Tax=Rhineura floridana TaxID=261503 RepID=UPI002AC86AB1|nr:apolipoprotein F [Rhineura floridana]
MSLPLPTTALTFFGFLLLHHGSQGRLLPMADPRGNVPEAHQSTSDSSSVPLHVLLSSISPRSSQLPQNGVSCKDLMPDALEGFAEVPRLSQTLIRAALALALQGAGCSWHAETLVLHLYKELGQADADDLLFAMAGALGMARSPGQRKISLALQFNLDQLARTQVRHCKGLMQVNGSLLHGQVHSVYPGFLAASTACHRLRDSCAGVASNGSSFFHVVNREGSCFLPHSGARSWLHQCQRLARVQRSSPEDCASEKEQQVHAVMEWIPGVSTFYNFATSIYFATQNCTDLAKDRAIDGAIDVGQDALLAVTGGASSAIGVGISVGLKPRIKSGVRALIRYFTEKEEPYPVPSNHSGMVTII